MSEEKLNELLRLIYRSNPKAKETLEIITTHEGFMRTQMAMGSTYREACNAWEKLNKVAIDV